MDYLSKNLYKYAPTAYFKGQLAGTVLIKFIIDKEGNVTNMTVIGSTEPKLNEAALKVISKSPKWKPAFQYNRVVNSYHTQPLTFERADRRSSNYFNLCCFASLLAINSMEKTTITLRYPTQL